VRARVQKAGAGDTVNLRVYSQASDTVTQLASVTLSTNAAWTTLASGTLSQTMSANALILLFNVSGSSGGSAQLGYMEIDYQMATLYQTV